MSTENTIIRELIGHTDEYSAFLHDDYPYGRLRCRIKFWIEDGGSSKGFRFVSQTENPKNLKWNKPHKGTYMLLGMAMYQINHPSSEEHGYVKHAAISQYSSADEILKFLELYPGAHLNKNLPAFIIGGKLIAKRTSEGIATISINKEDCVPSASEQEKAKVELAVYDRILDLLRQRGLIGQKINNI